MLDHKRNACLVAQRTLTERTAKRTAKRTATHTANRTAQRTAKERRGGGTHPLVAAPPAVNIALPLRAATRQQDW